MERKRRGGKEVERIRESGEEVGGGGENEA